MRANSVSLASKGLNWYGKTGTALEKQNLVPTGKHGGGDVMIWGCMAASEVGR